MSAPGARNRDMGTCPVHGPSILAAAEQGAFMNQHAPVRAGDMVRCRGAQDFVVTGSQTVRLHGVPMARVGDRTMHGGSVTTGSGNVNIGGPTIGTGLGTPRRADQVCKALAKGRANGDRQQSYGNCGLESARLLILQRKGKAPGEDELLDEAINDGLATQSADPNRRGGTQPKSQREILRRHGVPADLAKQTPSAVAQAVAERRGVIAGVDAGILWQDPKHLGGGHAVNIIGANYDNQGRIVSYKISDTGVTWANNPHMCCEDIPAERLAKALLPRAQMVVTNEPIWSSPVPATVPNVP